MKNLDRSLFLPHSLSNYAYYDRPLPLGYGATISAPHMHAFCLEKVASYLKPNGKVLDIGSGSGFIMAAMYELMGQSGSVIGVEHIPELCEFSIERLREIYSYVNKSDKSPLKVICDDGRKGYAKGGPYQVIHVGAAFTSGSIPNELID